MESLVIFRGVKTITWLWPWGSNPIHSHGILDHDMHHNKGKWFSCLIQVCISTYSYQHILMTETHTSSDVVLSCGRCGVGGERDWGGVWGGNRSGITLLVVLWRGDCTLAVNRNKTTSLKPRLCNVLPISMCSTFWPRAASVSCCQTWGYYEEIKENQKPLLNKVALYGKITPVVCIVTVSKQ